MVRKLGLALAIFLILPATAKAGEWRLRFEPKGKMHLALRQVAGGATVLVTVMALTGDDIPGPCVLRLDGVPIDKVEGPPYYFIAVFRLGGEFLPVLGEKSPQKVRPIVLDEEWFLREHSFEAYFQARDERGRTKKDKADAPSQQFILSWDSGVIEASPGFTKEQVEEAAKQGFDQGRRSTEDAFAKERQDLLARINDLAGQVAEAKLEAAGERAKQREWEKARSGSKPGADPPAKPKPSPAPADSVDLDPNPIKEAEVEIRFLRVAVEDLDGPRLQAARPVLAIQTPLAPEAEEIGFAQALLLQASGTQAFTLGLEGGEQYRSKLKGDRHSGGLRLTWPMAGQENLTVTVIIKTNVAERRVRLRKTQ